MAPFGGADVAECLVAAGEIKDLDPITWHRAWQRQAEKAEALAVEASTHGDGVSARHAFMRASNYFRAAGYMFHDRPASPDQRALQYSDKVVANFRRGVKLLPGRVLFLDIPFEDYSLPAYLYLPPASARLPGGKAPIFINTGGADSVQEELYYLNSIGPDLGYALLTFEGPGQGVVLRRHKRYMRPDWENVVGVVIDFLQDLVKSNPQLDLDLDRIAVSGATMGGYYALRAAADPRVRACVAIDPFYDMWEFATHHVSPLLLGAWADNWVSSAFINSLMKFASGFTYQLKWELSLTQWIFGVDTPAEALLSMKKFTLKENFLKGVNCPVLVSAATHSLYLDPARDTQRIYNDLQHLDLHQKRLWIANEPEDGGLQAKVGAFGLSAQKTFQFLDEHFRIERAMPANGSSTGKSLAS